MPRYVTVRMTRDDSYLDRQLRAGQVVELPAREALRLIAKRMASKTRVEKAAPAAKVESAPVAPPAPPAPVPTPVTAPAPAAVGPMTTAQMPNAPADGDRVALRAEYEKVIGRPPFSGWSADMLREKIAAAKAGPQS